MYISLSTIAMLSEENPDYLCSVMQNKIGLIIIIVFFLTLLISIKRSRKDLWTKNASRSSRIYTIRAMLLIVVILLFLFFSLVR